MKIEYHPYTLRFAANFSTIGSNDSREGALLRITFEDGLIGFADCHPWVELGDAPLDAQLSALSHPDKTALLKCSLRFARIDAKARHNSQSVFDGLTIPLSHQLISLETSPERDLAEGILHFKIKTGVNPDREITTLTRWAEQFPSIKLRIDFNAKCSRAEFLDYWRSLSLALKRCIEYVEDPYPYEEAQWKQDQHHLGVNFAADKASLQALRTPDSTRYIVHKPAVEDTPELTCKNTRLVVTSYLDHPIGQMCAAYTAAKLKSLYPKQMGICGLLTHKCYRSNPFIDAVRSSGPQLLPAAGTGFGFNPQLKELSWLSP